nr:hypothetical protein [Tanacetum cinerariifolium]
MLEEMVGISLDSMLDKWHRISKGYNAWQNGGIQGAQNAGQNAGGQSGGNQNRLVAVPGIANQNGNGNVVAARAEGRNPAYLQTQLLIAQKEEAGIQLQEEEFSFMAAAGDLDKIEEVNTKSILMANLQHASTSEQYTDLLKPIPKPQLVPQNDNHVTFVSLSMVQSGGTVETSYVPNEETRTHQETVYRNLVDQVAQLVMHVEVLIICRLGANTTRGKGWPVNPKSTRRSFQRKTAYNNRNFSQKVDTAKGKVNTARPNSAVLNTVKANKGKAGEGPTSPVGTQHTPTVIKTSPQLQKISNTYRKTRTRTRRMDIRIPQSNVPTSVLDEAITKEMHDGLGRANTSASSLESE